MLDINYIRDNKDKVIKACINKGIDNVDIEALLTLDNNKSQLQKKIQDLRQQRNKLSKQKPDEKTIKQAKDIKNMIQQYEKSYKDIEEKFSKIILKIPNIPLDEVPVGKDETANTEIKKSGQIKNFDFPLKDHITLAKDLDLVDFEAGSQVCGFRGYFLKKQLAELHMGLFFYIFQKLVSKGFCPIIAPSIVKEFSLYGSAHFPWGRKNDIYQLNQDDSYLSGTAEIPVMAMLKNTTFKSDQLPKKYVAFSSCFRREAGSYGKDTKGLYRVHEFYKIEQVIIAENNLDHARQLHQELQDNCEEILKDLELPYRVMLMSTGEMGEPQILKYDTETWMPSRKSYGETMSNSIMGDFQCRRLNIKYQAENKEKKYCYSLNNTAIASPRIYIALLENHQQKDGSVLIPKVLQKYLRFDKISK